MGAWLEGYEALRPEQQERVQRWIQLNLHIAKALRIPFQTWIDDYVSWVMAHPLDFSFMKDTVPDLEGGLGMAGSGASFSKDVDPATAATPKVPLRAQNNLGRFSPSLRDRIAALLEGEEPGPLPIPPGDVAHLQKIFRSEKALANLKREDFRKVELVREELDVILRVAKGKTLFRMSLLELGAVLRRPLV